MGALIGLDEGVITQASGIKCLGTYYGCTRTYKCDESVPGHADNLRLAIAHSCNSFFYNTFRLEVDNPQYHSSRLGLMKWKEYVNAFGLGHRLGVDLPSEDAGNIPDTAVYDKEYNHSWNSCTMVTMGIGQDKMQVTPLQMVNAICIVANKGFFYTPHFVKSIEGAPEDDTLLSRFHVKHEPVTNISDAAYEVVHSGMQDVIEIGTGRSARIPGINMCGKTGTAQNKQRIDGRVVVLNNHSLFVCFAPRENPKIAVAVIVENGGHGSAQAAPIASLLVEKYLNDTIRTERLALEDDVTGRNLMPKYLVRNQFKADSSRSADWARQSGDSTRWIKYQTPAFRSMMLDTSFGSKSPLLLNLKKVMPYKSALAERMARLRAAAAANAAAQPPAVNPATPLPSDSNVHRPARQPDTNGQNRAPVRQAPSPALLPKKDSSGSGTKPIPKDTTQ